jgi:hypothetical protein
VAINARPYALFLTELAFLVNKNNQEISGALRHSLKMMEKV